MEFHAQNKYLLRNNYVPGTARAKDHVGQQTSEDLPKGITGFRNCPRV